MLPGSSSKLLALLGGLGLSGFAACPAYAQSLSRQEVVDKIQFLEQQILMLKENLEISDSATVAPSNSEEAISLNIEGLIYNVSIPGTSVYGFKSESSDDYDSIGDIKKAEFYQYSNIGYQVNLNYDFDNSPWSIKSDYMSLSASTSDSFVVPYEGGGGRYSSINSEEFDDGCFPDSEDDCYVKGERDFDLSHLKIGTNYGHKLSDSLSIDLGVGFQYADVYHKLKAEDNVGSDAEITRIKSSFTGVGPYVEAGMGVDLGGNFSLSARATGGVLVGNLSSSITDDDNVVSDDDAISEYETSATATVPNYALDIGIEWAMEIAQNTTLVLNGGYEFAQYFGAVDGSFFGSEIDEEPNFYTGSSDVILDGFKVGVELKYVF